MTNLWHYKNSKKHYGQRIRELEKSGDTKTPLFAKCVAAHRSCTEQINRLRAK